MQPLALKLGSCSWAELRSHRASRTDGKKGWLLVQHMVLPQPALILIQAEDLPLLSPDAQRS